MILIKETEFGNVEISENLVSKVAGKAAVDCYGVIGMASKNFKEDLQNIFKKDNFDRGIKVIKSDDKYFVEVHVVLSYGGKIDTIAQNIMDQVNYSLETFLPELDKVVNVYIDDIEMME